MRAAQFFMFVSVLGFLGALSALRSSRPDKRPLRRPPWLPMLLTVELIPLRVLARAGLILIVFALGGFDFRAGRVGLMLTAATWTLYAWFMRKSFLTHSVMAAALTEAGIPAPPRPRLPRGRIVAGWPWSLPSSVERIEDIEYAPGLKLDIYRATRPSQGSAPVLLHVHGGSWRGGNRRQQARPLIHRMAASGWICVSIDYPLSPDATYPEHLVGVKRAIAWIKQEIGEYGGDAASIVITGGSAGAHLAAMAALTPNEPEFQPGFGGVDTSLAGAVTLYGIYDFFNRNHTRDEWPLIPEIVMKATKSAEPGAYRMASPLDHVSPHAPPWLIIHGDQDGAVPPHEARQFYAALESASDSPVAYAELPGATHTFDIVHSVRSELCAAAIAAFADNVVSICSCVHHAEVSCRSTPEQI